MKDRIGRSSLAIALASAVFVTGFSAQPASAQFGRVPVSEVVNVFLPAPREIRQRLSRAEDAIAEGRYSDAVAELGEVLIDPEAEDYFIGARGGEGTQSSLKAEAQRMIGELPKQGAEAYELQFGARAKQLFEEAVRAGDEQKLTDVTRMFFHTKSGYAATMVLGRYRLDQGRPLAAALAFRRLAASPAAKQLDPELSILLATCWLYAGMAENANDTLLALKKRYPDGKIRIGKRDLQMFEEVAQAVPWLRDALGAGQEIRPSRQHEWVVHRGNASRNATSTGGMPLNLIRWAAPLVTDHEAEETIQRLKQEKYKAIPALPSLHPLAVRDWVFMRTPESVMAVNFKTGKRTWEFPWMATWNHSAVESMPGGGKSGSAQEIELNQRISEDAPFGQLASDGEHLFMLDGLEVANNRNVRTRVFVGGAGRVPSGLKPHNRLVALDIATEGKLAWQVGDEEGYVEPQLAGAFFLGPPLPLLGQLYVLAEFEGELRLVVLDAKTGRLQWTQQLAHLEGQIQRVLFDRTRRLAGASPSFADGILICPTSAGAVVAVDLSSRALLWGYQYKRRGGTPSPFNRGVVQQSRPAGNRWSDATVTIGEGRVLMTPVESDQVFCLDLLTGESAWPSPRSRGDMLYTAAVHDGQAIMVGKNKVTSLLLSNGTVSWESELGDGVMPSGRGYLSGSSYYLPVTSKHIFKINLSDGEIVERTKTDKVLGNLICYKGCIISQGIDSLRCYWEDAALRESVAEALRENPNDHANLIEFARLQVQDGELLGAIETLQHARKIILKLDDPDQHRNKKERIEESLADTFLVGLEDDFAEFQPLAAEIEEVLAPEQRRGQYVRYLRLMAEGLHKAGRLEQALDFYLRLTVGDAAGVASGADEFQSESDDWRVRQDRWVQARLSELAGVASDELRRAIDAAMQQRLQAATAAGGSGMLRRFVDHFGTHPTARLARLQLAERYLADGQLTEAHLQLAALGPVEDPHIAAPRAALLARLLEQAGRIDAAARKYRQLQQQWGDTVCLDGKTGRQLVEEVANQALAARIAAPPRWAKGNVEQINDQGRINLPKSGLQVIYPLQLHERQGDFPRQLQLWIDRNQVLVIRDAQGADLARVSIPRSEGRQVAPNYPHTHGRMIGHLLVLTVGFELIGVDVLAALKDPSGAIRWRKSLASTSAGTIRPQLRSSTIGHPWGRPPYVALDAHNRQIGQTASLGGNGFCFLYGDQLICADLFTGKTIWQRFGVADDAEIFGDANYLFLAPRGGEEALVFSAVDGSQLGTRAIAASANETRWTTHGRNVMAWTIEDAGHRLRLFDAWTQQDRFNLIVKAGSKAEIIAGEEVAVMQPSGEFAVYSLANGGQILSAQLESEPALQAVHVLRSDSQYLLSTFHMTNRPLADANVEAAPPGGIFAPDVNGNLYAIDRSSGRLQWPAPAQIHQHGLPLDQPLDSPVIVFLRHITSSRSRSSQKKTNLLCIDRRDGRVLLDETLDVTTVQYRVVANVDDQTVSIALPSKSFLLKFTEDPAPPEPPVQTGAFSSLAKSGELSSRAVVGRIFGALGRSLARPDRKLSDDELEDIFAPREIEIPDPQTGRPVEEQKK